MSCIITFLKEASLESFFFTSYFGVCYSLDMPYYYKKLYTTTLALYLLIYSLGSRFILKIHLLLIILALCRRSASVYILLDARESSSSAIAVFHCFFYGLDIILSYIIGVAISVSVVVCCT
jgi:hypothetical protein